MVVETDREARRFGGYEFADAALLGLALTHRSCGVPNNERLEFLGDAVLGLLVAEWLYRRFPEYSEGELTRLRAALVSGVCLAGIAAELGVPGRLRLGRGERRDGGAARRTILAGTLEAILGAIWLDGGAAACRGCVERWFAGSLEAALAAPADRDDKTRLQEYLQARGEPLPVYSVVNTSGPDHARRFEVSCSLSLLPDPVLGSGSSRREAEKCAAARVLERLAQESPS